MSAHRQVVAVRRRRGDSAPGAAGTTKKFRGARRTMLAGAGAMAAFGLIAASAASLGTLTNRNVAAANAVVSTCDTDGVTSTFTSSYSASAKLYEVATVVISDINAACSGQNVQVTLAKLDGTSLEELTGTATGTGTLTLTSAGGVGSELVENLAVVISQTV